MACSSARGCASVPPPTRGRPRHRGGWLRLRLHRMVRAALDEGAGGLQGGERNSKRGKPECATSGGGSGPTQKDHSNKLLVAH